MKKKRLYILWVVDLQLFSFATHLRASDQVVRYQLVGEQIHSNARPLKRKSHIVIYWNELDQHLKSYLWQMFHSIKSSSHIINWKLKKKSTLSLKSPNVLKAEQKIDDTLHLI